MTQSSREVDEYGYSTARRAFIEGSFYDGRSLQEKRAFFERQRELGEVVVRYVCPECGGPHLRADHVEPKVWKSGPEAAAIARNYMNKARNGNGNGVSAG